MGLCLQCQKWVKQTPGKKAKQFCNDTCRSNYRYAQNKKKLLIVEFKAPHQKAYHVPKSSSTALDEPLHFIPAHDLKQVYDGFVAEIPNLEFPDEFKDFFKRVKNSGLPPRKQDELINGSRKTNF
jgi:hypothetical protein